MFKECRNTPETVASHAERTHTHTGTLVNSGGRRDLWRPPLSRRGDRSWDEGAERDDKTSGEMNERRSGGAAISTAMQQKKKKEDRSALPVGRLVLFHYAPPRQLPKPRQERSGGD